MNEDYDGLCNAFVQSSLDPSSYRLYQKKIILSFGDTIQMTFFNKKKREAHHVK
jgi:hypothetical protein